MCLPYLRCRLKHYRFLRPAASTKAVAKALRFVQLLPRKYVDARTYNMLVSWRWELGNKNCAPCGVWKQRRTFVCGS